MKVQRSAGGLAVLAQQTITGTPGDDVLAAQGDGDTVLGRGGNDTLTSLFNETVLSGGQGNDDLTTTVEVAATAAEPVEALATQAGGAGDDTLIAEATASGDDIDVTARNIMRGSGGNDLITATAFLGFVFGAIGTAENRINGGAGDDVIDATAEIENESGPNSSFFSNIIHGGAGNDMITALADSELRGSRATSTNDIRGDAGHDTIEATAVAHSNSGRLAENMLDGGSGNDLLTATTRVASNTSTGEGRNTVFGGSGHYFIVAEHQTDGQNDTTALENIVDGGAGDDTIDGAMTALAESSVVASNLLRGSGGNDQATANITAETASGGSLAGPLAATNDLSGGSGSDVLSASITATANQNGTMISAINTLSGGSGNDVLRAFIAASGGEGAIVSVSAVNTLRGGGSSDVLTGEIAANNAGRSELFGDRGADLLTVIGGTGNVLDGGAGRDRLVAGAGDDLLLGDGGADTFVFDPGLDQGTDTLGDFGGAADQLQFIGLADLNDPGLADDLEAITTVADAGTGLDVTVTFVSGTVLVFQGQGTGAVESIADLVEDPEDQLLGGDLGLLA